MQTCSQIFRECYKGDTCPPHIAQVTSRLDVGNGIMPLYDHQDIVCDYGADILQLAGYCCGQQGTLACDFLGTAIHRATAQIYASISNSGYNVPLSIKGKPIFEKLIAPEIFKPADLIPGTPAHIVYWLLRDNIFVFVRFMLYRDGRKTEESKPNYFLRYEQLQKQMEKGIKLPAYIDKIVEPSKSGFVVAGRSICKIPFDDECSLPKVNRGCC